MGFGFWGGGWMVEGLEGGRNVSKSGRVGGSQGAGARLGGRRRRRRQLRSALAARADDSVQRQSSAKRRTCGVANESQGVPPSWSLGHSQLQSHPTGRGAKKALPVVETSGQKRAGGLRGRFQLTRQSAADERRSDGGLAAARNEGSGGNDDGGGGGGATRGEGEVARFFTARAERAACESTPSPHTLRSPDEGAGGGNSSERARSRAVRWRSRPAGEQASER